jgi:DnaK suppressor protein
MGKDIHAELLKRFRPRLEEELAEIDRLSAENASWSAPVELDQQSVGRVSRIDAMQMQAMSQAVQRRRVARRTLIQQALKRMEEGEFGYCTECEEIAPGTHRPCLLHREGALKNEDVPPYRTLSPRHQHLPPKSENCYPSVRYETSPG